MRRLLPTILLCLLQLPLHAQTRIAFLADVHLQDLYGSFEDSNYKGVINPKTGKPVLARTMEAQLHSTRIFNENYFAFIAALEDIAHRGIKIVALPGDYTDDGQAVHLRGLRKILNEYTQKHGIQFFITTGNHDPVAPWDKPSGKNDFLGNEGKTQAIYSTTELITSKAPDELPAIITKDIASLGYEGITHYLGDFGYYPSKKMRYWATPFSSYTYENYSYTKALNEASYTARNYEIKKGYTIPDASYVTEPVEGVWLLALDGNVYLPKTSTDGNAMNPGNYSGTSTGYNNVLENKQHLIQWVTKLAADAARLGKTLITFSHYPMVEFNDNASGEIKQLLGKGKWQMEREPVTTVAEVFANAGIYLHFAGHMHINDTGVYRSANGKTLFNIQSPSLAAYIPAYKVLIIQNGKQMEIETITIDSVPGYDELFELYKTEYNHLKSTGAKDLWNFDILKTNSYREFTLFHLTELVRLRMIPQEWPKSFTKTFTEMNGMDILKLYTETSALLKSKDIRASDLKKWTGMDWITDLYKLQSADCLALNDIGEKRLQQYELIIKASENNNIKVSNELTQGLLLFYRIFYKLKNGSPAGNFVIDLEKNTIIKQ
jgi:3',5'-cyclic AMP phosphodiesterase CpdA